MFINGVINNKSIPFDAVPSAESPAESTREDIFGCMRGKIWMSDDFDEPLDDFKEYME
jgi:hypothetical protein